MTTASLRKARPLLVLALVCSGLGCQDLSRPGPVACQLTTGEKEHIEALIEELASPNSPPDVSDGPLVTYPDDYDYYEQGRAARAIKELQEAGRKAFPVLVAHSDDRRYSCTRVYAAHRNWSVGDVCFLILRSQVENYDQFPKSSGPMPHALVNIYRQGRLEAWWGRRESWTLQKLQLEAIDHRIEGELAHEYKSERRHIVEYLKERRKRALQGALPLEHYGI